MIFNSRINQKSFFAEVCMPRIKEILDQYKKIRGNLNPPIDPFLIAAISNCHVETAPKNVSYEGLLIPTTNGFIIRYREDLSKARKNLTICHEVAHTFFYEFSSLIPRRIMKHPNEEGQCFDIARKLLVPEEPLREAFNRLWSSKEFFKSLERFSSLFKCSLEIMAYRLTTDTSLLKDEMIIFWRYKYVRNIEKAIELTEQLNFSYEDFRKEPKLPPELETLLPSYQRFTYIYKKVWPFIEKVLKSGNPTNGQVDLEWRRKIEGKMKYEKIPAYVTAKIWEKTPEQLKLNIQNNSGFYGVISVVKK